MVRGEAQPSPLFLCCFICKTANGHCTLAFQKKGFLRTTRPPPLGWPTGGARSFGRAAAGLWPITGGPPGGFFLPRLPVFISPPLFFRVVPSRRLQAHRPDTSTEMENGNKASFAFPFAHPHASRRSHPSTRSFHTLRSTFTSPRSYSTQSEKVATAHFLVIIQQTQLYNRVNNKRYH